MPKFFRFLPISLVASFLFFSFSTASDADLNTENTPCTYERLYETFMNLPSASPKEVAHVQNLEIKRDVATFHLLEGKLYVFPPILNRPTVLFFKGEGIFKFTPPIEIEKNQLKRFFGTKSLNEKFKRLFVIFADTTYEELSRKLHFEPNVTEKFEEEITDALKYLSAKDKKKKNFNTEISTTLLNQKTNGLFYAQFSSKIAKPLFFEIDPYDIEEVKLLERAETGNLYNAAEVICQFNKRENYGKNLLTLEEEKELLRITDYQIESTIKGNLNLDFSARAKLNFTSMQSGQRWIYFRLFYDLQVDSILWEDGRKATFFKGKENPVVWIQCDHPLQKNERRTLRFFYHGDLLKRDLNARIFIRSSSNWYPRYGSRVPATFDLTFHIPHKFPNFACVGKEISTVKEKDYITTHWKVTEPINFASFNFGDYDVYDLKTDKPPLITVMAYKGYDDAFKDVGGDVVNAVALYNEIFGPCPVERLFVTAIPYVHGQAFKGLIHLSELTFFETGNWGYDEIFRGHEVAHQWWGIAVDYATYHDKWLSEGLSTFAGLKYMQTVLHKQGGTKKYFDVLNDWRELILSNRKYIFDKGKEAGPIYLGYRTNTSQTEGDYNLIIYKKGAWVFHMLRMMMINVKNLGDETLFTNMMRDFYQSYLGKKASTEDFKHITEKHLGMPMDWFFKQWIFGVDIPKYSFSFDVNPTNDGKFLIQATVKQENVPEDFRMPVLFKIDFGKYGSYITRKWVEGPISKINLLKAPIAPKTVVFNYLQSVLAE